MTNITLLSQIIKKLNRKEFKKIVDKLGTDKHNKGINSWTHFASMLFMQLANSNSLSEISNGLRLSGGNLNHLGYLKQIAIYGWSLSNLVADLRGCTFLKIDLRGFLDEPFKPPNELITHGK